MGCSASRDAAAVRPLRRARRRRVEDPAKLCRERAALARAVADRRAALAAAHAAYFPSLVAVGGALRRFTVSALAAPVPVNAAAASSSTKTARRHMMRSSSTVPTVVYEDPYARPRYTEGQARYGYVYGSNVARERTPSPPSVLAWDFFDPFAHCDGFVEDYRYRRSQMDASPDDSDELRRMEGIPELEDEMAEADAPSTSKASCGDQNAMAKTPSPSNAALNNGTSGGKLQTPGGGAHGKVGKLPASSSSASASNSNEAVKNSSASLMNGSVPAPIPNSGGKGKTVSSKDVVLISGSSSTKQQERHEEKTTRASSKGTRVGTNGTGTTAAAGGGDDGSHGQPAVPSATSSSPLSPMHLDTKRSVTVAMDEVYWLFTEASNRGVAVLRVLGKGKAAVTCRAKLRVVLTVSASSCIPKRRGWKSKASRSKRSTSSSAASGAARANDVHKLSSTLDKLWVWEKRLYREIKDKEKLQKQCQKMKNRLKLLQKQGGESIATDATQMSISLMRSKISVGTSTINALSLMLEKIRDEELYTALTDLIQRLRALWKAVLETHEKQLSAILESDIHQLKAMTLSQSSIASTASEECDRELKNWRQCFDMWIGSQKSFVEALNKWLKKWLPVEVQEDAPSGVPQPAPHAFAVSEKWLQATEKVPMDGVQRAMDHFSKIVHEFKKRQEEEQRHKQKADDASKDYHAKREDLKAAFGVITGADVVAVMENPKYKHDEVVRDLAKARRRRDEERNRHGEILCRTHLAASAALPFGLIPMLQEIIYFFRKICRRI